MKEDQSALLVYLLISLWYGHCNTCSLSIEEETDRRESKGRRCCLGDRIRSIPCRTTDLAPG